MTTWSEKHLKGLLANNKIRNYNIPEKAKNYSSDRPKNIPKKTSKALEYLKWNLWYWCNEKAVGLEFEYRFCQDRGWRFDFAIPSMKIAIEYEGGIFMDHSGHNTAKHYTKDTEKYNRATVLGWRVIRVTALNYTTVISQLNELIK